MRYITTPLILSFLKTRDPYRCTCRFCQDACAVYNLQFLPTHDQSGLNVRLKSSSSIYLYILYCMTLFTIGVRRIEFQGENCQWESERSKLSLCLGQARTRGASHLGLSESRNKEPDCLIQRMFRLSRLNCITFTSSNIRTSLPARRIMSGQPKILSSRELPASEAKSVKPRQVI